MQDNEYIDSSQGWAWAEVKCALGGGRLTYGFICQYDPVQANHTLSLSLTGENLNFHAFQVWYRYRANYETLFDNGTFSQMTGFRLSWRIENPSVFSGSVTEPGKSIQTPMFKGTFDPEYFKRERTYIATLELPDDLTAQVGNGSLTIEMEVDLREGEGDDWVEYDFGSLSKYQLFNQTKIWAEAEAACQSKGGHLASVTSQDELEELVELVDNVSYGSDREPRSAISDHKHRCCWVGGRKDGLEGVWKWSDGSPWNSDLSFLPKDESNSTTVYLYHGGLYNQYDEYQLKGYICQNGAKSITSSMSLVLSKGQLNFTRFRVRYTHKALEQEQIDSWERKRMTGFKLNWFITGSDGARLSAESNENENDNFWAPALASLPPQHSPDPMLVRAIHLARQARIENSTNEIVQSTIKEKASKGLVYCESGRSNSDFIIMKKDFLVGPIDHEEDILNGFKLYFAVLLCMPNSTSYAYAFFDRLISGESKRTLLQATVNTIQTGDLWKKEATDLDNIQLKDKEKVSMFYQALDKIFDLQFGKILLAVSSKEELQFMLDKDWPFFGNLTSQLGLCLNGTSCTQITQVIQNLGELLWYIIR